MFRYHVPRPIMFRAPPCAPSPLEMPRSPGHVYYDRLQSVLIEGGFDAFAEASCRPYYAARMGAPSVPPGRYFRMHLVGYF